MCRVARRSDFEEIPDAVRDTVGPIVTLEAIALIAEESVPLGSSAVEASAVRVVEKRVVNTAVGVA